MSNLAAALDLLYEDDDVGESGLLADVPVRLRVRFSPGDVSPLSGELQADGVDIRVRRTDVVGRPVKGAQLTRLETGEVFAVQSARPFGRYEWRLIVAPEDES